MHSFHLISPRRRLVGRRSLPNNVHQRFRLPRQQRCEPFGLGGTTCGIRTSVSFVRTVLYRHSRDVRRVVEDQIRRRRRALRMYHRQSRGREDKRIFFDTRRSLGTVSLMPCHHRHLIYLAKVHGDTPPRLCEEGREKTLMSSTSFGLQ